MAKGKVSFDEKFCKGCGLCIDACPMHIIELNTEKTNEKGYNPARIIDMDKCIACASCAMMCPDVVITVEKL